MKKLYRSVLLGVILVGLVGAVATSQVTINYWHFYGGNFGKLHEQAIAKFNATHPDIHVNSQYIGSSWTGRDKLLTAIAAGTPPDVCMVDDYWIPQLAATGNIVKLGDYISPETKNDVFPLFWKSASYKGEIWAMPYASSNLVLYYNKDLFKEAGLDPNKPPRTWEDLVAYAQKLTKDTNGDGQIDQWGLMMPTLAVKGVIYYYLPFLWQNNGDLFNNNYTKCTFDSPEAVKALQFMQDLIYKYKVMPSAPPSKGFRVGKVAMTYASCARLNSVYRPAVSFEVGVAPLPMNKKAVTVAGGKYFVAFNTGKLEAVLKFINWMTNTANNLTWSMATGYIPLRQSVIQSRTFQDYLAQDPEAGVAVNQINYTRPRPSIAAYADISRVVGQAIEAALVGRQDPAAALKNAIPEANKVLQQWKEKLNAGE
jgi:ABC-type glycerol-3-phosphate transport system substrate-binding protein